MLRTLDRHAVHELLRAGVRPRAIAHQLGVSRRTVERVAREPAPVDADDAAERRRRRLGRPGVDAVVRDHVARLVQQDPTMPPGEVHRRLREAGAPLGLSTTHTAWRTACSPRPGRRCPPRSWSASRAWCFE